MGTLSNSTMKSAYASVALHAAFIIASSWAFYNSSVHTLELTGNSGGSGRSISLSKISFSKSSAPKHVAIPAKALKPVVEEKSVFTKTVKPVTAATKTDAVTETSSSVSAAVTGGNGSGSGTGTGTGNGSGSGAGDFDHGYLFGQIKTFFENRLGSTLNIRENQLIKIKVTLNNEGEILDAILVQGKLEMSSLRRVISVAKNIPLKSFWKAGAFPQELIIPLVLTPS